jgi:hypothetical protein
VTGLAPKDEFCTIPAIPNYDGATAKAAEVIAKDKGFT